MTTNPLNNAHYKRRLWQDRLLRAVATMATSLALFLLGSILLSIFFHGASSLNLDLFRQNTPSPGSTGGLKNAIIGSLLLTFSSMILSIPIGLLAGTYLAEYGRFARLSSILRFLNDILLSAPSICIGLFAYEIMVRPMQHFSGLAGVIALALIAIPIILRVAEDMLALVPDVLREAAAALGAPRWRIIWDVCFRAARHGILTGILLATARIAGETAPLLFTALNSPFDDYSFLAPMPNLPNTIYQFALSPYDDWQKLAWAGAFLITLGVLSLNIVARLWAARRQSL